MPKVTRLGGESEPGFELGSPTLESSPSHVSGRTEGGNGGVSRSTAGGGGRGLAEEEKAFLVARTACAKARQSE